MTTMDVHSKRPAASLALMLDWATEFGLTAQQCLVGTRLTPAAVRNPSAEVSGQQELKVITNIVAALGDRPGLGLQAASRYPVTAFGVWGFAILTSPTLGEAIDVAVRFVRLSYAFCSFETRRHGDDLSIVVDARAVPVPIRRFVLERDAAAIPNLYREILGTSPPPSRISFALPHPGAAVAVYEDMFGAEPTFDEAETSVTICAAQLNVPLPQASPHTETRRAAVPDAARAAGGQNGPRGSGAGSVAGRPRSPTQPCTSGRSTVLQHQDAAQAA
ncbi:AraC family transcriptional regulator [Mycolicibacterium sp.]|uniref:AraC family transcriptional regulator n=1 Tax=Mycolicibacterium sp. TaxID=2320850 RepID=UPI0037CA0EB7